MRNPRCWRADLGQAPWPPLHLALINSRPGMRNLSLCWTPGPLQRDPLQTASPQAGSIQPDSAGDQPSGRSSVNGSKKKGWACPGPGLQEHVVGSALCSPGREDQGHLSFANIHQAHGQLTLGPHRCVLGRGRTSPGDLHTLPDADANEHTDKEGERQVQKLWLEKCALTLKC